MSNATAEPEPTEVSWKELIFGRSNTLWFLVVATGFLLFELTAQPAMVAVAVCSKFGIADVRNGFWLRRTDPLRARGKVCFWFCLSQGLWKTTLVAFVAMAMFVVLANFLDARGGPPAGFIGSAMTFLLAFIMASLTTLIGALLARVGGVVVWIDGELTESRRQNLFPPREGTSNRIHWLLAGAMTLPVVIFLVATLIVAEARPGAVRNSIGLIVGLFVLPVGIFAGGLALAKTVVASNFDQCWAVESRRKGMTLRQLAIQEGVLPRESQTGVNGPES